MTWFTENPTPILLLGGLALLILAIVVWQTGRVIYFIPMGVVALVMASAVLIDYLVVTDREQVIITIHEAAAALEANDIERLKPLLTSSAADVLKQAEAVLQQYQVEKISFGDTPEVTFNRYLNPPSATARFVVLVQGKYRSNLTPTVYEKIPRRVELTLRLEDGRWRIEAGKHGPLQGED